MASLLDLESSTNKQACPSGSAHRRRRPRRLGPPLTTAQAAPHAANTHTEQEAQPCLNINLATHQITTSAIAARQKPLDFGRGEVAIRRALAKPVSTIGVRLRDLMNSKVTVTEQGRSRRISRLDVMLRQLANDAMRGDQRAFRLLMDFLHRYGAEAEGAVRSEEITSEDLEILSDYLRKAGPSNSDPDVSSNEGDVDNGEGL